MIQTWIPDNNSMFGMDKGYEQMEQSGGRDICGRLLCYFRRAEMKAKQENYGNNESDNNN